MKLGAIAVILWGAASAWAAAPFSHKLHLGMGVGCTTCHAAAPASTKPTDDLLPRPEACKDCHGAVPAVANTHIRGAVPVVHFSHAVHLKMGNLAPMLARAINKRNYLQPSDDVRKFLDTKNACEACHRGLEQSDEVTAAALPKMADCLVCHVKIQPPWSCEDCHVRSDALKPATHKQPEFFDTHSKGAFRAQRTTCAVCHGREFTCMGCH